MNKQKFKNFLMTHQSLAESTRNAYFKAVNELINTYGEEPTMEEMNEFIAKKARKRQPHVKYGIKLFLQCLNYSDEIISKLIKAKVRKPIIERHFLSKDQIMEIVQQMEKEEHKAIAMIQINTGARASEVLTLEYRFIKREEYVNNYNEKKVRYRLKVRGKGDKPRNLYINEDIFAYLRPVILKYKIGDLFLFLKHDEYTYLSYWRTVENKYKRYLEDLKKAASKKGYDIGTHDLRRSFANIVRLKLNDVMKVKQALGHSDIRTTQRYFDDAPEEIADTMLRFQENFI